MFNALHKAERIRRILTFHGIDPVVVIEDLHHVEPDEVQILSLYFLIDNNLKLKQIMADLTSLQAEVAQDTSVMNSAVTLIQGLEQKLAEAGTDPQKLADLQNSLATSRQSLAAAIAANTPAAPAQPAAGATSPEAAPEPTAQTADTAAVGQ